MSSSSNSESLNESWIEFSRMQAAASAAESSFESVASSSPVKTTSVNSKALEKLLLEAQRESSYASSRIDSLTSSRTSPWSQLSPTCDHITNPGMQDVTSLQLDGRRVSEEVLEGEDLTTGDNWIWDWSSRPEVVPPSFTALQFKHPVPKKLRLSIRNTRIMRGIVFSLENLPLLIVSHACTFILGAATVAFYLKKFCRWSSVIPSTTIS